ncbi:maleylpyruvate isomerase family mycothiol-dependent enzyme [Actinomadura rayongensis]|uniref:Maleylpyruvate isomerase family mycothiol-dependent enzyme n=1 Tax=Actinomadura rayongensis TaxID=1429076 RepID=A0A6I4WGI1_9ACTN|nr:maleylpyruvate isomerase family mycothiol-dependent enzyme [Actinomadura rayongensis]MXQ67445.1 maleylpyruvate isomerase family mycothiol-dependent enzyme [Actinomadura rayongensis]
MDDSALDGLDPFDLLDAEAARLDAYFTVLTGAEWDVPSRNEGWSRRDVLAHLAGEELYNHACLNDDLDGLGELLQRAGVTGLDGFNQWSVETRRGLPIDEITAEWRQKNAETRRRMRALGPDATLPTMSGPYPVGLQTFHYAVEYATHGDDIDVPVAPDERPGRAAWRARFGLFALDERDTPVEIHESPGGYRVSLDGASADLSTEEFAEATVRRLPPDHPLPAPLRRELGGA